MAEPDPRLSRRWLAAGALGVAVVLVIAVIVSQPRRPAPAPAAEPVAPAPAAVAIPEPLPPVGRAELLQAAAAAADAYAAGASAKPDKDALVGRRFEVRLPFGCSGPLPEDAVAADEPGQWRYDDRRKTIRISAQRQDWSDVAWVRALAAPTEVEAVEGFWLRRPWTNSEICPPAAAPEPSPAEAAAEAPPAKAAAGKASSGKKPPAKAQPAAPQPTPAPVVAAAPQTVGLAAFFEPGSSRVARRGARAYDYVEKADAPPEPGRREYRLAVSGRVRGYDDGRAVHCHAESPNQRPVCLIAVDFEKVTLEDPRTGEVLGSWGS
jgi:hypothetical protein